MEKTLLILYVYIEVIYWGKRRTGGEGLVICVCRRKTSGRQLIHWTRIDNRYMYIMKEKNCQLYICI